MPEPLTDEPIIEWTEDGYPTEESLQRLCEALQDFNIAETAFYAALRCNRYSDYCGPERVEVRGEVIDVWAYHTGGWSGNEEIIHTLQERAPLLWSWLLERYDAGGHYYFKPPKEAGFGA